MRMPVVKSQIQKSSRAETEMTLHGGKPPVLKPYGRESTKKGHIREPEEVCESVVVRIYRHENGCENGVAHLHGIRDPAGENRARVASAPPMRKPHHCSGCDG